MHSNVDKQPTLDVINYVTGRPHSYTTFSSWGKLQNCCLLLMRHDLKWLVEQQREETAMVSLIRVKQWNNTLPVQYCLCLSLPRFASWIVIHHQLLSWFIDFNQHIAAAFAEWYHPMSVTVKNGQVHCRNTLFVKVLMSMSISIIPKDPTNKTVFGSITDLAPSTMMMSSVTQWETPSRHLSLST